VLLGPLVLLKGVREVSKLANPSDPVGVSQRAFDKARPQAGRYHDLPAARNIATTLELHWREVLEVAHEPEEKHALLLQVRRFKPRKPWLTDEYIGFVLKLVAVRLGVTTITPSQYRNECRKLLQEDRARWLHGRQLRLPTFDQLEVAAGGWTSAVTLAGLTPYRPAGREPKFGVTPLELLDRFYEVYKCQPSKRGLRLWARANGIRYTQPRGTRTWGKQVAEWKAKRQAQGLPVPGGIPPPGKHPDYTRDVGAALPGDTKTPRWDDVEECIAWIVEFLKAMPGEIPTASRYNDWANEGHENDKGPIPVLGQRALKKHGGWRSLLLRAQERSEQQANDG
jgi:hypothetical protein